MFDASSLNLSPGFSFVGEDSASTYYEGSGYICGSVLEYPRSCFGVIITRVDTAATPGQSLGGAVIGVCSTDFDCSTAAWKSNAGSLWCIESAAVASLQSNRCGVLFGAQDRVELSCDGDLGTMRLDRNGSSIGVVVRGGMHCQLRPVVFIPASMQCRVTLIEVPVKVLHPLSLRRGLPLSIRGMDPALLGLPPTSLFCKKRQLPVSLNDSVCDVTKHVVNTGRIILNDDGALAKAQGNNNMKQASRRITRPPRMSPLPAPHKPLQSLMGTDQHSIREEINRLQEKIKMCEKRLVHCVDKRRA